MASDATGGTPPPAPKQQANSTGAKPVARRTKTPTVLQMESVECGAAALGIILATYGRIVPLEELRLACGVSRDGSTAKNILAAGRRYGLVCKGFKKELDALRDMPLPCILFWNFNHFLVLEGFKGDRVFLNDPATGPRTITWDELDAGYTGVVLTLEPGPDFQPGGRRQSLVDALKRRLRGSETAIAFIGLVGLAMVLPGIVIPTFSKVFVDSYLVGRLDGWFRPLLIAMGLTLILRMTLSALQQFYLNRLQIKLLVTGSTRFIHHVLSLPIEFFTQRYAGDISNRVGLNDTIAVFLSRQLASAAVAALLAVFYAVLMLLYSPLLTMVGVVAVALMVTGARLVRRVQVDGTQRLLQEQGKLVGTAIGGLAAIDTLKATGGESDLFATWSGYLGKTVTYSQRMGRTMQLFQAAPPALTSLTNTCILALGGLLVMRGEMTMGSLVAFQSLMSSFLSPVGTLIGLASQAQQMEGNMARLDDVLRYPVDARFAKSDQNGGSEGEAGSPDRNGASPEFRKLRGEVALRDVSFGYSRLAPPLIERFDLHLKPGARVALVGASGSGKSTIAKLVSGLYAPWEGRIEFDGVNVTDLPRTAVTNSVAVVDQDITLFGGTIRDNLTLWDPTVPESDLTRACKDAMIHDDITSRPGGYDGSVDEGGSNFSGGQRQRLEIARALVGNPRILVLDEATSALDPLTEQRIDQNLRRRGCTCIVIAHRLSTIRDADEIIVLHRGNVVQRGAHETLMLDEEGAYARLVGHDLTA